MSQWKSAIKDYTGQDAVLFTDKAKQFGEVTIAMVSSLNNWLKKKENKLPQFDVLILDESHHTGSDTFYRVALKCDARYRFGLTATPNREDGADMYMTAALGEVKTIIGAEELIETGVLARPRFEFIEMPQTFARLGGDYAAVYRNGITLNGERNKVIATRVKQVVDDGRVVYIHVKSIEHGEILSKLMKVPFVYSKSKDREEVIEKFRRGEIKVIVSTLLSEGFDLKDIDCIVMASGGKSKIDVIQRVGRALRAKDGKTALIIDFSDKGKFLALHTRERYEHYVSVYGDYVNNPKKK